MKTDTPTRSLLALVMVVCSLCPASGAVRFYALGDLPGGLFESNATGVSADGSVVVGTSRSAAAVNESFLWTKAAGIGPLRAPAGIIVVGAAAVSANGKVVAASVGAQAVRWSLGGNLDLLGDLPGGSVSSYATAISADGTVVGGAGWSANGVEPFRWTEATGMVGLGGIGPAPVSSYPQGISPDGSILVGGAQVTGGFEAFIADGTIPTQALGHLTMTNKSAYAYAVSANGVVVGEDGNVGGQAFRWSTGLGMVGLGDLPGGTVFSTAMAVSANASVIVGSGHSAIGEEAVRWDAGLPPVTIRAWLADRGIVLTGWTLRGCNAISANGRNIAGDGVNPDGSSEAWLVSELLAPPTIALTGKPKVRAKKNGKFKVQGTAADDAAVVRVEYQLGGKGVWKPASGTGGWLVAAKLKKSAKKTTLLVRSVDEDGQMSPTVFAKITR